MSPNTATSLNALLPQPMAIVRLTFTRSSQLVGTLAVATPLLTPFPTTRAPPSVRPPFSLT